jgi:sulfite reductase alpha subunit-like flavoprotein
MNGSSLSSEVKLATRKDEPWMASLHHDVGVQCDVVLTQNLRVTPLDHWQDVRHFSFLAEGHHPYLPGDVLMIHPENAVEEVDQILQLMGWTDIADCKVRFIQTKTAMPFQPRPPIAGINAEYGTTLRDILMRYLDLNAIPRRSFFAFIFQFTKDEFQKQRLIEFTSPEYIDELYDYTTRPRRSVLEVLQEFDTVKIPWQLAASVLPPLRGRQFSIASGGHLKAGLGGSTRFELLIALVKYKTVIRKVRQGVCTRYLAALSPGTKLLVTLQRGGLGISESDMAKPMVMIGPGTGVAPIRALLWEKLAWEEKLHLGGTANLGQLVPTGENVLFFGCRNQRADYFFQIDWNELKPKLPMQIFVAFSRDQGQKRYVQDVLTEQRQLVFRLLHDSGGIVFICGSSGRMPQAVREALLQSFQEFGKFDRPEAEKYLALMEREGRYKQETW